MDAHYEITKTLMNIVNTQMRKESATSICKCLEMYVLLLSKIDENPDDAKYQSIKKSSKLVSAALGAVPGGMDLLYKIGWKAKVKDFEEWFVWEGNIAELRTALAWAREKITFTKDKAKAETEAADALKNQEAQHLENLKKAVDAERKERYNNQAAKHS